MPGLPQQVTGSCTSPQDSERAGWEWLLAFVCLRESDISNLAPTICYCEEKNIQKCSGLACSLLAGASLLSC